jgi:KaiC/GvpD/RAD55 family RecA-like ATPase
VVDGREEYMRDLVWAALIGLYVDCPIGPPPAAAMEAVWADYLRNVVVQQPLPGEEFEAGLEREGRGRRLFEQKWAAGVAKWDTDIAAEAAEREAKAPPASQPPPQPAKPAALVPLVDAFPIEEAKLPIRDWAVPGLLLKRSLSVLVAPPGSGKSLLSLQLAIAVAVGIAWAGWTPRMAEKVLIINAEDDLDEMRRRLCAAARSMGVDQGQLEGRIFLAQAPESVVIARFDNRTKSVIRTPLVEELVATIEQHGIGVVVADPFAETFEGDENSNSEVKWAGILWREVARRTRTALLLVHHTKKYAGQMAGEADASRGGGALIGTARILVTLFAMTEDEAEALNIPPDERTDYVRLDDAKANYSKMEKARWFKKDTVTLANATAFLPGDDVGVLVPWVPPGALDGISVHTIGLALEEIDGGLRDENGRPTGHLYTASSTSKERWAGNVLVQHFGCSEINAKALIKRWLKEEVLRVMEYLDPKYRRLAKGLCAPQQNRPGSAQVFT